MNGNQPTNWDQALIRAGFTDGRGSGKPSWRPLANKVGVHQSTLAGMRDGTRETSQATVDAVAEALKMDPRTVAEWVGRARSERNPFKPHGDANLLTGEERKAVNQLIQLLAKPKKGAQNADLANSSTEKTGNDDLAERRKKRTGPLLEVAADERDEDSDLGNFDTDA